MVSNFESRQGRIRYSDEQIYNFISNFNNFKQFIPEDKIKDFKATEDTCSFSVPTIGIVGLKMLEKTPFTTIKVSGDGMANQQFSFWVQLKKVEDDDTRIKFTITADMNPMVKMMASKPLQNFLDKLVETMERVNFR